MQLFKSDYFEKLIIKLNAPQLKHKTNFFRLLSVSQKAWLGIRDSLISIKESENNRGLRMIIKDLINQLTQWVSLATAMENHDYFFGVDEIELVRSAQVTGNLVDILYDIAAELENFQQIKEKIKKAMVYPAILIVFSIVAVIILLLYVMPTIVSVFPSQDALPSITKFMLGVSWMIGRTWPLLLWWLIGIILLFKFLYSNVLPFKVFIDKLVLATPVLWGVVKTFYMYRFTKLLGQFYAAGVNPIVALKLLANIFTNFEYKKKAIEIRKDLGSGFSFFESMEGSKLFDPILIQVIHVGENTGTITEVLQRISSFYGDMLKTRIDMLMSFIEPILMAIIAAMIWVIVASIFLPMADLVNVIK